MSLCATAHPLYPIFTNIFGTSISEATMRPNPRSFTAWRCHSRGKWRAPRSLRSWRRSSRRSRRIKSWRRSRARRSRRGQRGRPSGTGPPTLARRAGTRCGPLARRSSPFFPPTPVCLTGLLWHGPLFWGLAAGATGLAAPPFLEPSNPAGGDVRRTVAQGESVIKCPSPQNVLKDTYDHSWY